MSLLLADINQFIVAHTLPPFRSLHTDTQQKKIIHIFFSLFTFVFFISLIYDINKNVRKSLIPISVSMHFVVVSVSKYNMTYLCLFMLLDFYSIIIRSLCRKVLLYSILSSFCLTSFFPPILIPNALYA